ncbi:MAG: DUF1854 domain-containing protein [Fimbriimonas sp.]|nr:DUF1854 domain-containing protein [Fimbriimonas sp.]
MSGTTVRYFEPNEIRAFRSPGALHPRVEVVDEYVILSAVIKRAFPLSNPNLYVSILDGAGKEQGVLRTTHGLDAESMAIFNEQLDRRYFTPHISRIDGLRSEAGMWRFDVQTQRGATRFYVRNWRDSAHETTPGRWQIMSVDGARFEILKLEDLDVKSLRLMDQLL